jgi:ABC-2 type transport system ATP-binding protein
VTRIEDVKDEGKVLFVDGKVTTDEVGEAAATQGIVLHELTLQRGSLEQAFMQMTGDSVEYHAHDGQVAPPVPPAEIVVAEEEKN